MTLTTRVRINHPIVAKALLDHVTIVAGGDPATAHRIEHVAGERDDYGVHHHNELWNVPGQGFKTLAWVSWSEGGFKPDDECPAPPAVVILSIDNPYGGMGGPEDSGRWVQAYEILPAVCDYLDGLGVPREAWWWEDESAGTWHPGTEDVRNLATNNPRAEWVPA